MSKSAQARDTRFRKEAEETAGDERAIQKEVDRADKPPARRREQGRCRPARGSIPSRLCRSST